MSAAQELIERGFTVDVYEREVEYVGGKARSVNVEDTYNPVSKKYLPGEHGFRFFPGFYQHITNTMQRIPTTAGKNVFQNLVSTDSVMIAQMGALPIVMPVNFPSSLKAIMELFYSFKVVEKELTEEEITFFAERIWQLMTSSQDRFFNEYDNISWWEYCRADDYSDAYRRLLVEGLTRSLVAAKAQKASTKTVGSIFLQLIYLMVDPAAKDTDRVLNAPTNDAWLDYWYTYLTGKGVNYHKGKTVCSIEVDSKGISSVTVEDSVTHVKEIITGADYYLSAMPVERVAPLLSDAMLKLDASLQNIILLAPNVEWMNGIQFYLNKELNLNYGHTIYSNSNWALTSISQIQFWPNYDLNDRGNGKVKSILSVDISDWTVPGNFNNKKAEDCTREEVKEEVLKQLQQELNLDGLQVLTEDMIEYIHLDTDIVPANEPLNLLQNTILNSKEKDKMQKVKNKEPLLVNQVNTWELRPNAFTNIANLFLSGDYVKTNTDLATMEGANEAARRAVNCILEDNGMTNYCQIWKMYNPVSMLSYQWYDEQQYKKGLAWSGKFPWYILVFSFFLAILHFFKGLKHKLVMRFK